VNWKPGIILSMERKFITWLTCRKSPKLGNLNIQKGGLKWFFLK
jgi:hypothetical protein